MSEDIVRETRISGNAQPNMRNEELFDGILSAYKQAIIDIIKPSLAKGIWTNRELTWFNNRLRNMTINTQNLLDTIASNEEENYVSDVSETEGDKVPEGGTKTESDDKS